MTDTQKRTLRWGYGAAVPEGVKAAWGARLIIDGMSHKLGGDLLHDRQDIFGDDEEAKLDLSSRLNNVQPWRTPLAKLIAQGAVKSYEAGEVTVFEDEGMKVVGNSNGSHGYFYIAGWLK